MLTKNMKFPATFSVKGNGYTRMEGVVIAEAGDVFFGYTRTSGDMLTQVPCVWNRSGQTVRRGYDMTNMDKRDLTPIKTEAEVQYEKLSVDQRAILAALSSAQITPTRSLALNYLMESLKVDVNLATDIQTVAARKEFK